jgi:Fic-DOC domain mobile mystery protein B
MSDIFDESDDAATPLTPEEKRDLIPTHIALRRELNLAEQENIALGSEWALRSRQDILTDRFVMELHRRMLSDVWKWAGKYRTSERNIGIDHWKITMEVRNLLDDVKTQIDSKAYPPDEITVRFHHRLVQFHPFPNGNGRHARLMADLLIKRLGGKPFSWGSGDLADESALRKRYIAALQAADNHDIGPLLAFARS